MIFWIFLVSSSLLMAGIAAKIVASGKAAEPECTKPRCCRHPVESDDYQPNVCKLPKDY